MTVVNGLPVVFIFIYTYAFLELKNPSNISNQFPLIRTARHVTAKLRENCVRLFHLTGLFASGEQIVSNKNAYIYTVR